MLIKVKNVTIPQTVVAGQDVDLFCNFDLQGMDLYAYRWFKNELEFYRYLPSNSPPVTVFDNDTLGIHIDVGCDFRYIINIYVFYKNQ